MTDPAVRGQENRQREAYLGQVTGWEQRLTPSDAMNVANMLTVNPNLSGDAASAAAISRLSWDDPMFSDIARKEVDLTDGFSPMSVAQATTRGVFTAWESLWDHGINTVWRTGVRTAQGQNPITAYRVSNQSYATEIVRQRALGNPIRMGSGWTFGSEKDIELPGYRDDLIAKHKETGDLQAAMQFASAGAREKYGVPITDDIHDLQNSTLINKTIDGVNYSVPASIGRALAITVFKPDTIPFNIASGIADGLLRVTADPLNRPFYELGTWAMARNRLSPAYQQAQESIIRRLQKERHFTEFVEGVSDSPLGHVEIRHADDLAPGEMAPLSIFTDHIEDNWIELRRVAKETPDAPLWNPEGKSPTESVLDPFGDQTVLGSPYDIENMTVGQFVDELEQRGGISAYTDLVHEHEIAHQTVQQGTLGSDEYAELVRLRAEHGEAYGKLQDVMEANAKAGVEPAFDGYGNRRLGADGMPIDTTPEILDLHADFVRLKGEMTDKVIPQYRSLEAQAERIAWDNFLNGTMEVSKRREEIEALVGITHKWRKWLNPRTAEDFLASSKSDPIVEWVARENRWEMFDKRFPMMPDEAKESLRVITDHDAIRGVLSEYLGIQTNKVPRLGAARLGEYISTSVSSPGTKHSFENQLTNKMRLGTRRYGAQSQPIVLSLTDPTSSKRAAIQWLKTIRATDNEITRVLNAITYATKSNDIGQLAKAHKIMIDVMELKLGKLGYTKSDIAAVLLQMGDDQIQASKYWTNFATNPMDVERLADIERRIRVQEVRIKNGVEQAQPGALSAVHEAQFSGTHIGMPNLRDTRRLVSNMRGHRESLLRGIPGLGLKETRLGFEAGWGLGTADRIQKVWRDWMLLRLGWPIRVIGEEILRSHAYGYGHWMSHPLEILSQIKQTDGLYSLLGDSMSDIVRLDGLGAGGWRDTAATFDMSRANWTTARVGEKGYESGLITELLQTRGSRVNRLVAELGVDKAFEKLVNEPEGIRILAAISKRASEDSALAKIVTHTRRGPQINPTALRAHLESIDAIIHQLGGGRWVQNTKKIGPSGRTVFQDIWGNDIIALQDEFGRAELLSMAGEHQITGRHAMNKDQLASALAEPLGRVDVVELERAFPNQQFHIVEDGHEGVRGIVAKGELNGEVLLADDMTIDQIKALEDTILGSFADNGIVLPEVVRTMTDKLEEAARKSTVDRMFEMLMQVPTSKLVRSPHFITRYTEEVARLYIAADQETRGLIEGWVEANHLRRPWDRATKKMLEQHGFAKMPGGAIDLDLLDQGVVGYAKVREAAGTATDEMTALLRGVDELPPPAIAEAFETMGIPQENWRPMLHAMYDQGVLPPELHQFLDEGYTARNAGLPSPEDLATRGAFNPPGPKPTPRQLARHNELLELRSEVDQLVETYGTGFEGTPFQRNNYEAQIVAEHFDELSPAAKERFGEPQRVLGSEMHNLTDDLEKIEVAINDVRNGGFIGRDAPGGGSDIVGPTPEPERDLSFRRPVMDPSYVRGTHLQNMGIYDDVYIEMQETLIEARNYYKEYPQDLENQGYSWIDEPSDRDILDAWSHDNYDAVEHAGPWSDDAEKVLFDRGFRQSMEGPTAENIADGGLLFSEWDWHGSFMRTRERAYRELDWYLEANGFDMTAQQVMSDLQAGHITMEDIAPLTQNAQTNVAKRNIKVNAFYKKRETADEMMKILDKAEDFGDHINHPNKVMSLSLLYHKDPYRFPPSIREEMNRAGGVVNYFDELSKITLQYDDIIDQVGFIEAHRGTTGMIDERAYPLIDNTDVLFEDLGTINTRIAEIEEGLELRKSYANALNEAQWEAADELTQRRPGVVEDIINETEGMVYPEIGGDDIINLIRAQDERFDAIMEHIEAMRAEQRGDPSEFYGFEPDSPTGFEPAGSGRGDVEFTMQEARDLEYLYENQGTLVRELRARSTNRGPIPQGAGTNPVNIDRYYNNNLAAYRNWQHPWWSPETSKHIAGLSIDELLAAAASGDTPAGFYLGIPRDVSRSLLENAHQARRPQLFADLDAALLEGRGALFMEALERYNLTFEELTRLGYAEGGLFDAALEAEQSGLGPISRFKAEMGMDITDTPLGHNPDNAIGFDLLDDPGALRSPSAAMAQHSTLRMEVMRRLSNGEISIHDLEEAVGRWAIDNNAADAIHLEQMGGAEMHPFPPTISSDFVGGVPDVPAAMDASNLGLDLNSTLSGIEAQLRGQGEWRYFEYNQPIDRPTPESFHYKEFYDNPGQLDQSESSQALMAGFDSEYYGDAPPGTFSERDFTTQYTDPTIANKGNDSIARQGPTPRRAPRTSEPSGAYAGGVREIQDSAPLADEVFYHGSRSNDIGQFIDADGNLVIKVYQGDFHQLDPSFSLTNNAGEAHDYRTRTHGSARLRQHPDAGMVIEIDGAELRALGLQQETTTEYALYSKKAGDSFTIPAGKWRYWAQNSAEGTAKNLEALTWDELFKENSLRTIDNEMAEYASNPSSYIAHQSGQSFYTETQITEELFRRSKDIDPVELAGMAARYDAANPENWDLLTSLLEKHVIDPKDLGLRSPWDDIDLDALINGTLNPETRQSFTRDFGELQDRVYAAEKPGNFDEWTDAERAAYDSGDNQEFSRLRGYTEDEIAEWQRHKDLIGDAPADMVQRPDGKIDPDALWAYKEEARLQREADELGITDEDFGFAERKAPTGTPIEKNKRPHRGTAAPSTFSDRGLGIYTPEQELVRRIDDIAKANAINDTKNLFYDLTSRANYTDMARYIFPFGDAFLEQLKIWSRAMLPMGDQTGQALKNWRRADVGVNNARKSGFFQEDEFGNETFNWPGAGLMGSMLGGPGNVGLSATIRPDQMMMMNLTPRGIGIPGTGPFIQIPASFVQNTLDGIPALRDAINWFAFGDYTANQANSPSDLLSALSPTYARRFVESVFGDESRQAYADEINSRMETLLMSGDDQYGSDNDRMNHTIADAKTFGSTLGFLRILDGLISPAQPRYEPTIAIAMGESDDIFWMKASALSDEWAAARRHYADIGGDDHMAAMYMRNRFGIDPFNMTGATRETNPVPYTKDAYDYARTNLELYGEMKSAMMMWLPSTEGDEFYLPAYNRAKNEGDRQTLTQEQTMEIRQRTQGFNQLNAIEELYNAQVETIDRAYGGDHRRNGWSDNMNRLNQWRNEQRLDVYAMYPPAKPNAEIAGLGGRPKADDILSDFLNAGTPGTKANDLARDLQPDLADWAETVTSIWQRAAMASIQSDVLTHSGTWWLTATDEGAVTLRTFVAEQINGASLKLLSSSHPIREEQLRTQIGWFTSRVLEPMFDGYVGYEELWLVRQEVPELLRQEDLDRLYPPKLSPSTVGAP